MEHINIASLQKQAVRLTDVQIHDLIQNLTLQQAYEFFSGTEEYFKNSEFKPLQSIARSSERFGTLYNLRKTKAHLSAVYERMGDGYIFSNNAQSDFCFIHPSTTGGKRMSMFNIEGFYSHADLPENPDVGNELYSRGFRKIAKDQGVLDKIFTAKAISSKNR